MDRFRHRYDDYAEYKYMYYTLELYLCYSEALASVLESAGLDLVVVV